MSVAGRDGPRRVSVNGEDREVAPGTSVTDLLHDLDVDVRGVAVAVDGEVVPRPAWDGHELAPGQQLEILTISQGG